MKLRCKDSEIDLSHVAVMGVLNVTPDSFSDGGAWLDPGAAVARALRMAEEGAAIIDVGGQSTRPGAEEVSEEEEKRRVLPVIERLSAETTVPISIDTRKPAVARAAIEAGASILNDESGEDGDAAAVDRVVADTGCGVVVMHTRGDPVTMLQLTQYSDVVADVRSYLCRRADELIAAGVRSDAIAVDPGIGFAKEASQSLEVLRRLDQLTSLRWPVLVGPSRKSFIGRVLDVPVHDRLEGTAVAVAWAVSQGAAIVRVHDVKEMVRVVRMTEAIMGGGHIEEPS
jgi:dihydropteroate synthase